MTYYDGAEGFFVQLLESIWQDRAIAQMETYIHDTPAVQNIPDPNACHPAFSHAAYFVRHSNEDLVEVAAVRSAVKYLKDEGYPASTRTSAVVLSRKKAYGPAPFVGDPRTNEAAYIWSVWVDGHGRYIAGDSELIWRFGWGTTT